MTKIGESGRGNTLAKCYRLAALIAAGETLDRNRIVKELDIGAANADRHLQLISDCMNVEKFSGRDGLTSIRASRKQSQRTPAATVVAACFGGSLAKLFEGTPFEQHLRDIVAHVVEGVRDVPRFKDRDRQFLFISPCSERALRNDGGAMLASMVDAILDRRVIRVRHRNFRGDPKQVYVRPLSLAMHQHQLYVLGLSEKRLENIRFSRITAVFVTKDTFEYPRLDEYDPRAWFRDSIGIFIHDDEASSIAVQRVKVRLDRRWASYVETHRWHESQRHTVDEHGVLLELTVRTCPELEALVLGFGADAEVLEPSSLRERVARRIVAMGARYAELPCKRSTKRHGHVMG